jgi:hypothetical protein
MSFRVTWRSDDGENGTQTFATQDEAVEAARSIRGVALVGQDPAGSIAAFRDGNELDGAKAVEATEELLGE